MPRERHHLVVGMFTSDAAVNRDAAALVKQGGNAVEFIFARQSDGPRPVDREMLVLGMGSGHVRRHDQHSDAAFVDGGLACQYGLALRLLRRADFGIPPA